MNAADFIDTLSLLQSMAPMSYDSSRLVDVACIAFAHVDAAHIASLRAVHSAAVQAQFAVRFCLYGSVCWAVLHFGQGSWHALNGKLLPMASCYPRSAAVVPACCLGALGCSPHSLPARCAQRCSPGPICSMLLCLCACSSVRTRAACLHTRVCCYEHSARILPECIPFAHVDAAHTASVRAVHSAAVQAQFAVRLWAWVLLVVHA